MDNNNELNDDSSKSVSEKVEKQELEKKFFSQKKEIKTKLEEANKALNENIKEVEADYEKTIAEEPNLLTEEEKEG